MRYKTFHYVFNRTGHIEVWMNQMETGTNGKRKQLAKEEHQRRTAEAQTEQERL